MISQTELIRKTDWSILLVLDACRFDYFEKYYKSVFGDTGKLEVCESPSTFTLGWIKESFGDHKSHDTVYISTDPVNDTIRDFDKRLRHGRFFSIRDHFKDVVDLWSSSFLEPGYVDNAVINDAVIKAVKKYPSDRIVAKYWAVHDPYFYWVSKGNGYKYDISTVRLGNLRKIIYELMSDELFWTIRNKMGWKPESWLEGLWREEGREGIIKGYTEDLKLTLKYCKELMDKFPDKNIVITGDHGEYLGEKRGKFSHGGHKTGIISEVPWYQNF